MLHALQICLSALEDLLGVDSGSVPEANIDGVPDLDVAVIVVDKYGIDHVLNNGGDRGHDGQVFAHEKQINGSGCFLPNGVL